MLFNTDPDPWAGLPITLWRNNDLDPRSFAEREALVQQSAKELKIAEAIAIVDTLINLEHLVKVAQLESKAKEAGITDDRLADFLEKKAGAKFVSVTSMIPWLRG